MHQNIRGGGCSCHEVTHTLSEAPKPDTHVRKRTNKPDLGDWQSSQLLQTHMQPSTCRHLSFQLDGAHCYPRSMPCCRTLIPCGVHHPGAFRDARAIMLRIPAPSAHCLHIAFAAGRTSCTLLCFPKALRQPARAKQANLRPVALASARCSAPGPNAMHALHYEVAWPQDVCAGSGRLHRTASRSYQARGQPCQGSSRLAPCQGYQATSSTDMLGTGLSQAPGALSPLTRPGNPAVKTSSQSRPACV